MINANQGARFTAEAFTSVLQAAGVRISMDGRSAWRDSVFIERFWWTLKHEEVYLRTYESVGEARQGIGVYLDYYNAERSHSGLQERTPKVAYCQYSRVAVSLLASRPQAPAQVMNPYRYLRSKRNCLRGGDHR